MSKFYICPFCGATLDHGETCDCRFKYTIKEGTLEVCDFQNEEKTE